MEELEEVLTWTKTASTSLIDIYIYPAGFINNTINGFIVLHAMVFIIIIVAALVIIAKKWLNSNDRIETATNTLIIHPHTVLENEPNIYDGS